MIPGRPMAGITAGNADLINTQRRISQLDSSPNPQQDQLAQYLVMLTQRGKVGTPEYFMAAGEYAERQKTRQEAQAKQPDQPKVIQRLIADAAQETAMNRGVAAVPVRNVGNYAPGGIVAFEDGGSVPRYQAGSVVRAPVGFTTAMTNPMGTDPGVMRAYYLSRNMPLPYELMTDEERQRSGATPGADPELRKRLQAGIAQIPGATPVAAATPSPAAVDTATAPDVLKQTAGANVRESITGPAPDYKGLMGLAKSMTSDIMGAKPTVPTDEEALSSEREMLKKAGVDFDIFKKQIAEERKALEASKGDRTEAANMRLLEAGLAILGGESPHAFVNIGKGASGAVKGFAEDIKELKKIERDRNKAIRDLQMADNQLAQGLGKSAAERKAKAEKRIDDYNERTAIIQSQMANTLFSGSMQKYVADIGARTTMTRYGQQDVFENRQRALNTTEKEMAAEMRNPLAAQKYQDPAAYEAEFNRRFQRNLRGLETGNTTMSTGLTKNPDGTFTYNPGR
jgi:hypothetical protein